MPMQVIASERASEQASERTSEPQAREHERLSMLTSVNIFSVWMPAMSCRASLEASIIGFQIIRRPVLHTDAAYARARLTVLLNDTRIKNFEVEL